MKTFQKLKNNRFVTITLLLLVCGALNAFRLEDNSLSQKITPKIFNPFSLEEQSGLEIRGLFEDSDIAGPKKLEVDDKNSVKHAPLIPHRFSVPIVILASIITVFIFLYSLLTCASKVSFVRN